MPRRIGSSEFIYTRGYIFQVHVLLNFQKKPPPWAYSLVIEFFYFYSIYLQLLNLV